MTAMALSDVPSAPSPLRVLGLFAKQPQPGQVKTRLAAALSADLAARIAEAFLLDAVDRFARIDAQRLLAFAPPEAESYFAELSHGRFTLEPQTPGNLGQRMAAWFQQCFRAPAQSVVLVGADSPTLPLAFVEQAFAALGEADLVLGPATDGGYYLIGCRRYLPRLFEEVAWGSSRVLSETVARFEAEAGPLELLPPWYDVDTLDDWTMLQGHVAAMRRAGLDPGVPHTERLLQGWDP
jgi:rSAM/selenodomain-associated transferase 1